MGAIILNFSPLTLFCGFKKLYLNIKQNKLSIHTLQLEGNFSVPSHLIKSGQPPMFQFHNPSRNAYNFAQHLLKKKLILTSYISSSVTNFTFTWNDSVVLCHFHILACRGTQKWLNNSPAFRSTLNFAKTWSFPTFCIWNNNFKNL